MELMKTIQEWQRNGQLLGNRFCEALVYASIVHAAQRRKGGDTPYVGHLLAVAAIIIDAGGSEDEAIAGLLHDAVEDQGGAPRAADILVRFGPEVTAIVLACSDAAPAKGEEKSPWPERKAIYRDHLEKCRDASVYLVSAADKLHNLRSTWSDYGRVGTKVWARFNASPPECINNYFELCRIYAGDPPDDRRTSFLSEMRELIEKLSSTIRV